MAIRPLLRSRAGALLAFALAPVAACGGVTDPSPCDDGSCVEAVRVSALRRYLVVGDTTRLTGEVTSRGTASTDFRWRAERPTIASVDLSGLVTANAVGRGPITAVPLGDTSVVASVFFDVVTGDTAAVPVFTGITDPATRSLLEPGQPIGDSVDVTLEYVSGSRAGEGVTAVLLRLVGVSGKDTTVTLPLPSGTGILRSTARLRFGPATPGAQRAFPVGLYAARAILQLQDGTGLQTDVPQLFTAR